MIRPIRERCSSGTGVHQNGTGGAFTGNNTTQTDLPEGYVITVNDLGGFFVGHYSQGGRNYIIRVGDYQGGTSQAQVDILLHELVIF